MMDRAPPEVTNFFLAMQAGRAGGQTMARLFAENAEYQEPFSGEAVTHRGREAILAVMAMGWETPLTDMHLVIDRVETQAGRILVDWTCLSPMLPNGKGQGRNSFELENGLITRLVTTLKP